MNGDIYRDPIIEKVKKYLNDNGPTKLQDKYINGDVLFPNKSELPICYITKDQTLTSPANNMEDEHQQMLVATIILDMTDNINHAYDVVAGTPELFEMCEARDPATYQLKERSLLYQLRNAQQLDNNFWIALGSPVQINYGMGIERRGPGIFSVEATIRFTVRLHLPAPGIGIQT